MSFVEQEDIISTFEGMEKQLFKELRGVELSEPFLRMTWADSMKYYGRDKPDLRFGMKFVELVVSREKIESVKILKSSRRSESIIFLLFLIPGTPKDLLSYLVGLTDIKLSHWIIICAVGRMPAIFLSVLSGNALNKADYTFVILMFAVMIALSICGFFFYRSRNKTDSGSENDKE